MDYEEESYQLGLGDAVHVTIKRRTNPQGLAEIVAEMEELVSKDSNVLLEFDKVPETSLINYHNYCGLRSQLNLMDSDEVLIIEDEFEREGYFNEEPQYLEGEREIWREGTPENIEMEVPEAHYKGEFSGFINCGEVDGEEVYLGRDEYIPVKIREIEPDPTGRSLFKMD